MDKYDDFKWKQKAEKRFLVIQAQKTTIRELRHEIKGLILERRVWRAYALIILTVFLCFLFFGCAGFKKLTTNVRGCKVRVWDDNHRSLSWYPYDEREFFEKYGDRYDLHFLYEKCNNEKQ